MDLKDLPVQPFPVKAQSRQDGQGLCPGESWECLVLGYPPLSWKEYSNGQFFSLWGIFFLFSNGISPGLTCTHYPLSLTCDLLYLLMLDYSLYVTCRRNKSTKTKLYGPNHCCSRAICSMYFLFWQNQHKCFLPSASACIANWFIIITWVCKNTTTNYVSFPSLVFKTVREIKNFKFIWCPTEVIAAESE